MSRRTAGERKKSVQRLVIVGILIAFLSILAFVPAVREDALGLVKLSEQLRDAQGTFATLAVILVVLFAVVENAEKMHFIWEMGHKVLGYDLEAMERHEREFTDLPDDYTRRPALEKELITELAPQDEPKVVVLLGAHDSGKTTALHYVIPRKLNRAYKGRVILCRGDLQGLEGEMGDTEDKVRQRLAKRILRRVIQHAEVPGDSGETIESMHEAVTEHFERERKRPWLIVIDQIDTSKFPYSEALPALFGQCNTVLIATDHIALDQHMLTVKGEDGEETVARRDVHVVGFTADEAMEMFHKEVRKRRGTVHRNDVAALRSLLRDASPGAIQRLSDIYATGGLESVRSVLDPSLHGMRRAKVIANSVVDQFSSELRHFIAGLTLIENELVNEPELAVIAASDQCKTVPFVTLLHECARHGFLELVKQDKRKRSSVQQYAVTKLGRGIADVALQSMDRATELRMGASLLQFYRGLSSPDAVLDSPSGLRNILGMMAWAERVSGLPNRDVVRFVRKIREALYFSGEWDLGVSWLQYAEEAAVEVGFSRSIGEIRATLAQLLEGAGRMHAALRRVDAARKALRESSLQSESDLHLAVADEAMLQASLDYDALLQCWLTHLEVVACASLLPAQPRSDELARLTRLIEETRSRLRSIPLNDAVNKHTATRLVITLDLDAISLALRQSDAQADNYDRAAARRSLQSARALIASVRHNAVVEGQIRPEMRAQIEFADAALSRQFAVLGNPLQRLRWRMHAKQCLVRCLGIVEMHSLEQALLFLEGAQLALTGISTKAPHVPTTLLPLRRMAARFSPRWYRLHAARRQLLSANSVASALGADATQVSALMLLVGIAGQLASIEGNPLYLRQSGEYARSAMAISERLRDEMPNLLAQAQTLPSWVPITAPIEAASVLVDQAQ